MASCSALDAMKCGHAWAEVSSIDTTSSTTPGGADTSNGGQQGDPLAAIFLMISVFNPLRYGMLCTNCLFKDINYLGANGG